MSSAVLRGQDASTQPVGIPDDWTHHKLIFSDPGTAEQALACGEYDKWLKITSDPRYKMQQLKRALAGQRAQVVPEIGAMTDLMKAPVQVAKPKPNPKPALKKDWSMLLGGTANATGTVGSLSGNVSGSSVVTIHTTGLDASPPTAATQTGAFSAAPTYSNNPGITVVNGGNTLSLTTNASGAYTTATFAQTPTSSTTPSVTSNTNEQTKLVTDATASSATGTFSTASPPSNLTLTIASGVNTLTLSNGGTKSSSTGTFTSPLVPTESIIIPSGAGSNTVTFNSNGTGTVTFSAEPSSSGQIITIGSTVYQFETTASNCSSGDRCVNRDSSYLANFISAIGGSCYNTGGCPGGNTNDPDVLAVQQGSNNTVTLINRSTSTAISTFSTTSSQVTLSGTSIAAATASNVCTSSSAGTFVPSTSAATLASNLATAINSTSCQTTYSIGATASYTASNTYLVVTDSVPGTSGSFAPATAYSQIFGWSSTTTGANGSNACTSSSAGTFATSNSTATLASNVAAAINSTSCQTTFPTFVTASYTASNSYFTVANTALGAGSFGGANDSGYFAWSGVTTGSNGTINKCTGASSPFSANYVVSSTLATMAQNAVAAINACPTTAAVVATYTSGGAFTIANTTFGSAATQLTSTGGVTNVFTFSATTAGSAGSNSCTGNTTGTYAYSATLSTLASNLNTAIGDCTASVTGVTSSLTGAPTDGIKITSNTPGTTGGSGITLGNASGVYSWTGSGLNFTGVTDGSQSSTTWTYWSGDTYVSQAQVAANIVSTINTNATLKAQVYAVQSGDSFTVYAQAAGATGDYASTSTAFSALTWSSTTLTGSESATAGLNNAEWFPFTYAYYTTVGVCDGQLPRPDFVGFNTGLAGSANQPTTIAYDNLYTGCSSVNSLPVPNILFQYNTGTGETVSTSPVVSEDGTQVAFVQTDGTNAQLIILKWAENPALVQLTSTGSYASSSGGCTAPCMVAITFADVGGIASNDTTSSPFYDYKNDIIYVGDTELTGGSKTGQGQGYLHKFTNVFNLAKGNTQPVEVTATFPVVLSSSNPAASPVLDESLGVVLVGPTGMSGCTAQPSCGENFHYVTTAGAVTTNTNHFNNPANVGLNDTPVVDGSVHYAYVFTPADLNGNAAVWQYHYDTTGDFTASNTEQTIGAGDAANDQLSGAFDNLYFTGATTGNLYVCGRATGTVNTVTDNTIWRIPITTATNAMGTPVAGPVLTSAGSTCSSVNEYYNGTNDYIFFSVQGSALSNTELPGCTAGSGCIISFDVTSTSGWSSTKVANSTNAVAGGTGGLVIDNAYSSPTGTGNVYFYPLSSQACSGPTTGAPLGEGTGTCGIQVEQVNVAE